MMNSFLKKTSWLALAIALTVGGSQWVLAGDTDDSGDTATTEKTESENKQKDAETLQKIYEKVTKRLETDRKADADLLKGLKACQGKYTITYASSTGPLKPILPTAGGVVRSIAYSKRVDMRDGSNACQDEVYRALEDEGDKYHFCIGEPRFDPANMATGIFNLDADVDVEHDNEYAVQDLARMCAIMGITGNVGESAGAQCCAYWQRTYDIEKRRPVRFWAGGNTPKKIRDFCCNLTKREEVEDGEVPEDLNEDDFCQTEAQEKADCMENLMDEGADLEEAFLKCDVDCYGSDKQFADLFHDSDSESDKSYEEKKKEIDKAMQECYTDTWSPSQSCLTSAELAPIMPTTAAGIVTKDLNESEKGTGKKLGNVNQKIIGMMLVTPDTKVNSNVAKDDKDSTKAYEDNINSVRENQNKIKVNAATRAVALGKRAVWLGTSAGTEVESFAKQLEKSDDFLTMFKGMAELQAQHLQKTNQNTALKAKLSELSSIDGIISGHVVTTNEEALSNAGNKGVEDEDI